VIPFSVLDLCPIIEGGCAADSFRNSLDLAQHAENWGYKRFWLAEHHNVPGIASAATSVVIAHIAGGTRTIRVGSGGVMLPNHSPLAIAEQFGTLAALFPGRIDLGLGRAPGTDGHTARALRRGNSVDDFPQDVLELQAYLGPVQAGQVVRAIPGCDSQVPIWLLGSSLFSAQLAAQLGLPFAFASHFAPADLVQAMHICRALFKPSAQLARPYAIACINVIAADTDAEARRLLTSLQLAFLALRRGMPRQLPPPVDDIDCHCTPAEKAMIDQALARSIAGSKETVRRGIEAFIAEIQPDELMIAANIYDHAARLRSFEIAAGVC
jgi:luciferase family oxidoreductase group 1